MRCVKEQLEGVEVHFATKKPFAQMLKNNPYVDGVHVLEDSDKDLINRLKKEGFDLILDLHHNIRTRRIKSVLNIKSYSFDKLNLKKFLLVNLKINKMPDVHIVDRYFETTRDLGIVNDKKGLDYFIPEKDEINIETLLPPSFLSGFVTFAIGGQHNTKRLPSHKMIELCQTTSKPIVLLGGPDDEKEAKEIEQFFTDGKKIFNAVGKVNLNQSASLVNQSEVLYTHDTGMMHIAAGL